MLVREQQCKVSVTQQYKEGIVRSTGFSQNINKPLCWITYNMQSKGTKHVAFYIFSMAPKTAEMLQNGFNILGKKSKINRESKHIRKL